MIKRLKWILLPCILLFYALLYIATSVDKPLDCYDDCLKWELIDARLKRDTIVAGSGNCKPAMFCVYVKDDANRSWSSLADSACVYIKEAGFQAYSVNIIRSGNQQDTVLKQSCP